MLPAKATAATANAAAAAITATAALAAAIGSFLAAYISETSSIECDFDGQYFSSHCP